MPLCRTYSRNMLSSSASVSLHRREQNSELSAHLFLTQLRTLVQDPSGVMDFHIILDARAPGSASNPPSKKSLNTANRRPSNTLDSHGFLGSKPHRRSSRSASLTMKATAALQSESDTSIVKRTRTRRQRPRAAPGSQPPSPLSLQHDVTAASYPYPTSTRTPRMSPSKLSFNLSQSSISKRGSRRCVTFDNSSVSSAAAVSSSRSKSRSRGRASTASSSSRARLLLSRVRRVVESETNKLGHKPSIMDIILDAMSPSVDYSEEVLMEISDRSRDLSTLRSREYAFTDPRSLNDYWKDQGTVWTSIPPSTPSEVATTFPDSCERSTASLADIL